MQEIWRDVEGYEGLYQVSNMRRVKSLNYNRTGKERALKLQKDKDGYLRACLCKEGKIKNCQVHRLVGQAFLENPEGYPEINHKDENPLNNCAENLEWCTREYNNNYGARNEKVGKTMGRPVRCVETNTIYFSACEAQRKTGIFATHICDCVKHKKRHHTAGRCHWEYV